MMRLSTTQQALLTRKIDEVLSNAGLPLTSPLHGLLGRDAEVVDNGREFYVHVPRPDRDISLRDRLEELRNDPMFKHNFPASKPTVDKRDLRTLSEKFDAIAAGTVRVE